ncbi:MAG: homocysteine S-methyltransferase family protein, partial [Planctomycetota bacterium]|nr:homocysteine S-methyltransferase family protein [Planctomycetota bacterium]
MTKATRMKRSEFHNILSQRPLVLDGATGTELFKRGLPPGAAPELWVMHNPQVIQAVHQDYFAAGSDIVLTCTFGANRIKLADHNLQNRMREINIANTLASRKVVPRGKFLFGDLSPTGQLVEPFGPFPFDEAVDVYRQQAKALLEGGVDGFMIETMMDLQETRAALIAVREVAPDHPVITGITYDKSGKTIGGTPPETALVALQALGADAVGCNCSTGPGEMLVLLERMLPHARVPLFIKPNAGMPCLRDGCNHYDLSPGDFAEAVLRGVNMGARLVGGCCGTTPDHIRATRSILDAGAGDFRVPGHPKRLVVSSSRALVDFSPVDGRDAPLRVIGERINPTGKKAFQAELLNGDLGRVLAFAEEQAAAGADLLDVNLGLGGIDEAESLRTAVVMLAPATHLPLAMDSVNPKAMEAALRVYPGRALVNSVSGERGRLDGILPLAAKYGAAVIVLPVADGHIPATAAGRMEIVDAIMVEAAQYGLGAEDVIVDGLAMTVSADPAAALATLETIGLCRQRGLATILGLSNVSFGMPERKWLNATFLSMGMAHGLSAVIANPAAEILMEAKISSDALLNRHDGAAAYINRFAAAKDEPQKRPGQPAQGAGAQAEHPAEQAARAILKGSVKQAAGLARKAVDAGTPAGTLVSEHLVPAIMKAGELFETGTYYLPQLMLSGEAMRLALAGIEPDLAKERTASGPSRAKGKIVIATVEGDVHDIGKNLVALMLRNHGYEVFDLGKDVSSESVIQAAREHRPDIIGLSALMTTTLAAMEK